MYNKFTLNNGIRIVVENIPYVKSVSIGLWVETGSRREKSNNNGISHFIEHMLFKGTKTRTAKEIAESIDNVGGQLNAFTSKECTCYYAKVLDNHLPIAIDVLADMLFNSKFDEEDIEKEKSVVLEEINMYEDSPEDLVHDLLSKTVFERNSLGFPILGSIETLKQLTREDINNYFNAYYIPENIVISVVGSLNVEETVKMLDDYFGHWKSSKIVDKTYTPPTFYQRLTSKNKKTEQLHLCFGMEGVSQGKDDLYALLVLNNIFGGSMSSRLFQKIREDKGLVYSIYSYPSSYKDIGLYTIYAGLNPKELLNVAELIINDIKTIKKHPFKKSEVIKSKEQLKGNYILGLESTSSRMTSLGKSELLLGKIFSPSEILQKINNVSLHDVIEVVHKVFDFSKLNVAYVGNVKDELNTNKNLKNICFL